jgi:hypothetical protein
LIRSARKAVRKTGEWVLLDKYEGWSRLHFRGWEPKVEGALLIGLPASPLVYASIHLRARNIPYVVDMGDPWILTHPDPPLRGLAATRANRAEQQLWAGACGAIVTTGAQADAISALRPGMPVFVRPNGYDPAYISAASKMADRYATHPPGRLSLVHFGGLYSVRVDVRALLDRLVKSGRWREVAFAQYGSDWNGTLDTTTLPQVHITTHEPVPWEQAISISHGHNAAIVIGNHNPHQLPSKAVQYLTLPVPRIALTNGQDNDELTRYVTNKAGWMTTSLDDPQLAERMHDHLERRWSAKELAPPPGEAWPQVASEIAEFIGSLLPGTQDVSEITGDLLGSSSSEGLG